MTQDRFNQMVEKVQCVVKHPFLFPDQAAMLLRREHAAIRRQVKAMIDEKRAEIRCIDDGLCEMDLNRPAEVQNIQREIQVCNDMLDWLEERKNGTP